MVSKGAPDRTSLRRGLAVHLLQLLNLLKQCLIVHVIGVAGDLIFGNSERHDMAAIEINHIGVNAPESA